MKENCKKKNYGYNGGLYLLWVNSRFSIKQQKLNILISGSFIAVPGVYFSVCRITIKTGCHKSPCTMRFFGLDICISLFSSAYYIGTEKT